MKLETFDDVKKLVDTKNVSLIEISYIIPESKMYYHETNSKISLYFTESWCAENRELLNQILTYIIQTYKEKRLVINSGSLINNEIIKAIADNKNIEEVRFGNIFDTYTLKESDYIALKGTIKTIESSDVEESLTENFDEIIAYNRNRSLISYKNYDDLQQGKLYIHYPLNEEELNNLKHIGNKVEVTVHFDTNLLDIIEKLRSNGKNNRVIYELWDSDKKEKFNETLLKRQIPTDNVVVKLGTRTYKLKEYIEYEKMLYSFIEPARNLSPFEKYIYAYDIVKKFKEYKECKRNKRKARNLYSILKNNYMVCVGYSDMLGDLLNKLGIENIDLSVEVELRPYKARTQLKKKYKEKWEEMSEQERQLLIDEQTNYIPDSWGGHARRVVHIVDEKHGVNGLYISDPTWDNDLENDSYTHLLMTTDEVLNSRKKLRFYRLSSELLYSKSVTEFNDKLNTILNRTHITKHHTYEKELESIIQSLLSMIEKLDNEFYNTLYEKYGTVRDLSFEIKDIYNLPQNVTEFLYTIANYIVNNNNKKVDASTILGAVKCVYDNVFVGGISDRDIERIREYNSARSDTEFSENKFKK